jgi:hypothetical protein
MYDEIYDLYFHLVLNLDSSAIESGSDISTDFDVS